MPAYECRICLDTNGSHKPWCPTLAPMPIKEKDVNTVRVHKKALVHLADTINALSDSLNDERTSDAARLYTQGQIAYNLNLMRAQCEYITITSPHQERATLGESDCKAIAAASYVRIHLFSDTCDGWVALQGESDTAILRTSKIDWVPA